MSLTPDAVDADGTIRDVYLLHGWGMHAGLWGTLPERLRRDGYRPHAIELPGHGHNPPLPRMDLRDMVEAMLERIAGPGYLIGWSLGGLFALEMVNISPDKVTGLALTGVSPCFVARPDWSHGMARDTFDSFRERVRDDPNRALHWFLGLQVQNSAGERHTLRELRRLAAGAPAADTRALLAGLDILDGDDLRPKLNRIDVPVTVVHGKCDGLVPAAAAEILVEKLPNSRLMFIDDAGHAPFLSHADDFYLALRRGIDA